MLQIFPYDKLLTSQIEGFLGYPFELFVPFHDAIESWPENLADFNGVLTLGFAELLNHDNDLVKGGGVVLADIGHEVLDLVFFIFVNDELVGLLHVDIELLGEF